MPRVRRAKPPRPRLARSPPPAAPREPFAPDAPSDAMEELSGPEERDRRRISSGSGHSSADAARGSRGAMAVCFVEGRQTLRGTDLCGRERLEGRVFGRRSDRCSSHCPSRVRRSRPS